MNNATKPVLSALLGLLASLFGWSCWLIVLLVVCAVADWLTGSAVALKQGNWSSKAAREGLYGKVGTFLAVLSAGVFDLLVYLILHHLPVVELPFAYKTLLLPIVCIWYICTELGSLIENAGALGAPIPPFLRKAIALLKDNAEKPQ